jgi:hypothetical protein
MLLPCPASHAGTLRANNNSIKFDTLLRWLLAALLLVADHTGQNTLPTWDSAVCWQAYKA